MEKDLEKIMKDNVYSRSGQLIISKGTKIILTEENKKRLKVFGIFEEVMSDGVIQKKAVNPIALDNAEDFQKNLTNLFAITHEIHDEKGINIAAETMGNIIYNCKDQPWYINLNALVNYVDWIYSHTINTAIISVIIGVKLDYSKEELHELALGAILHDIGMILIPRETLLKKTKLEPSELAMVRNHCTLGGAMISRDHLSAVAQSVIAQHHERLDGSGYPLGLKGDQITEQGQIVMIADSFDTATTDRPYKEPKEPFFALNEMTASTTKYNQKIIDVLRSLMVDG